MVMDDLQESLALLTIDQAASVLGVSRQTIARRIRDGSLPAVKLG